MCDSPRTRCARRTTPIYTWREQAIMAPHVLFVKAAPGTTFTSWSQHHFVAIGMCAKVHTGAASNNRDHAPQSLYYCLALLLRHSFTKGTGHRLRWICRQFWILTGSWPYSRRLLRCSTRSLRQCGLACEWYCVFLHAWCW